MRQLLALSLLFLLFSCDNNASLEEQILADYLELNSSLERADLVACAAGRIGGILPTSTTPTDVFFYPIQGATDFRYFEAERVEDSLDFTKYIRKELPDEPVFNGYLWKFNNSEFSDERMGVVTYLSEGKLHVCTPIRLKTNVKPTEVNSDLITITENGLMPSFTWEEGQIRENVIFFQVISDEQGNLISGTYTVDRDFTFYDLDNVVFNITDTTSTPVLGPSRSYNFTLMGVSEDNWVNLFGEQQFMTN